jgi:hypothetical protein
MILDFRPKFDRAGVQTRLDTTLYEEEAEDEAEVQQRPKQLKQ